jgi:hypothetical protein
MYSSQAALHSSGNEGEQRSGVVLQYLQGLLAWKQGDTQQAWRAWGVGA